MENLETLRRPSNILGKSAGATGSTATFTTAVVACLMGANPGVVESSDVIVAVFRIFPASQSKRTHIPEVAVSRAILYLQSIK